MKVKPEAMFPGLRAREARLLVAAGLRGPRRLALMTDEQLLAVQGLGKVGVALVRIWEREREV